MKHGSGRRWGRRLCRADNDDPGLKRLVKDRVECLVRDHARSSEVVLDVSPTEKQWYRDFCQVYGLAMLKLHRRGAILLEKVDNTVNPLLELREILTECTGGGRMAVKTLLWHVRASEPELWKRLSAKGISSCSPKRLRDIEEEPLIYFDVTLDWLYIAPKGAITKEYAKPVLLIGAKHRMAVQKAAQASKTATEAVRKNRSLNKPADPELFCAFSPHSHVDLVNAAATILAQCNSSAYQDFLLKRQDLPAFMQRAEILAAFHNSDVLVVCGATGCGKTTQLPQFLLEDLAVQGLSGRVLCTQPRRISAVSVAERVAAERDDSAGGIVGYQVRFDHRAGPETALLFCTVGILLRHLVHSPTLEGVAVIVVDEVHERDIHTDFVLLLLRDLVTGARPDLKLVLMSATIDAQKFINYFQGYAKTEPCGQLRVGYFEIPGKTNFAIQEFWAEDILRDIMPSFIPAGPSPPRRGAPLGRELVRNTWASDLDAVAQRLPQEPEHVCKGVSNMLRKPLYKVDLQFVVAIIVHIAQTEAPGAILVFAPGWQDISDIIKELERRSRASQESWKILPLHSRVPTTEQRLVFEPAAPGERKIIVSTNVAETSVTVEDIVYVVDTGLLKMTSYSPQTNVASLETQLASRSNVQQRRGRAGRCQPGKLFKLYSRLEWEDNMCDSLLPEMQRMPVEELCLQVKALRLSGSLAEILGKALDPPPALSITNARGFLEALGALDSAETLTPLGWKLSSMPLHPALGKMLLLGPLLGCLSTLLTVCATLSAKSPFVMPLGKEREVDDAKRQLGTGLTSDHILFARVHTENEDLDCDEVRSEWCRKHFLSERSLQMISSMRVDLHRHLQELQLAGSADSASRLEVEDTQAELLAVLAASLPLAVRRPSERKFQCLGAVNLRCSVHPSSLLECTSGVKRSRNDCEDYTVLCWFSRMRTTDLYLHDCTLIADVLPLLLLAPTVTRREAPHTTLFEVAMPEYTDDGSHSCRGHEVPTAQQRTSENEDEDESSDEAVLLKPGVPVLQAPGFCDDEVDIALGEDGASESGSSGSEAESNRLKLEEADAGVVRPLALLIRVADESIADALWELRENLQELIGLIIGESRVRLPQQVHAAFSALRSLLVTSHAIHADDPGSCLLVSKPKSDHSDVSEFSDEDYEMLSGCSNMRASGKKIGHAGTCQDNKRSNARKQRGRGRGGYR